MSKENILDALTNNDIGVLTEEQIGKLLYRKASSCETKALDVELSTPDERRALLNLAQIYRDAANVLMMVGREEK